jgi:hypothetical protein
VGVWLRVFKLFLRLFAERLVDEVFDAVGGRVDVVGRQAKILRGGSESNAPVPEPATAILFVLGAAIRCWRKTPTCLARSKTRWA